MQTVKIRRRSYYIDSSNSKLIRVFNRKLRLVFSYRVDTNLCSANMVQGISFDTSMKDADLKAVINHVLRAKTQCYTIQNITKSVGARLIELGFEVVCFLPGNYTQTAYKPQNLLNGVFNTAPKIDTNNPINKIPVESCMALIALNSRKNFNVANTKTIELLQGRIT